jgi:putative membrane protein
MTDEPETSAAKIEVNTWLAIERNRAAYDRTMLAWVRTAISLISFGFTIYAFFHIQLRRGEEDGRLIGPREFGLTMVIIGLLSLALAVWENRKNMQGLRALGAKVPPSMSGVLAALISLLGILALIVMTFRQ